MTPAIDRLFQRVRVAEDGCWIFLGALTNDGYAQISSGRRSNGSARAIYGHRLAYEFVRGAIPSGLVIDHLCRNRACQNPWHMRAVTNKENILAEGAVTHARRNAIATHCQRGHEFTPENTYSRPIGGRPGRDCRTCNQLRRMQRTLRERVVL